MTLVSKFRHGWFSVPHSQDFLCTKSGQRSPCNQTAPHTFPQCEGPKLSAPGCFGLRLFRSSCPKPAAQRAPSWCVIESMATSRELLIGGLQAMTSPSLSTWEIHKRSRKNGWWHLIDVWWWRSGETVPAVASGGNRRPTAWRRLPACTTAATRPHPWSVCAQPSHRAQ